ncbi:MAG TPA: hypothetical protein VF432_26730, partial [Thermoanaerobaculia bacterium]
MKYPAIALCLFAVIACSRDAEVADVDTATVSMTSVTVDTAATGTTATFDPATATVVDVDRRWGALSDWDADRDKRLARNEFDARWGGLYDRWDRDRNAAVSRDELADTWYDLWDNNNDDFVDEQEWTRATKAWDFEGIDWNGWRDWDIDNDGRLLENEFDQRFGGIYDRWDTDRNNALTRDELR